MASRSLPIAAVSRGLEQPSLVGGQSPSFCSGQINPSSVSFLGSPRFGFRAILALGLTRPLKNQCLGRLDYCSVYVTCALSWSPCRKSGHIQSTSFTTHFSVESWPLWLLILDYNLPRGESVLGLRRLPSEHCFLVVWPWESDLTSAYLVSWPWRENDNVCLMGLQ